MTYYKCGSVYTTQNSNVVVDTASGVIANFQTPLAMPLKSLEIDVNAKQDLHGQSGPYPAGGGINRWDEEWELGAWSSVNGSAVNYTDRIRCKNLIPVLPSTSYCIRFGTTASSVVNAYDENGDFIENLTTGTFGTGGRVVTTPANCYFIKFSVGTAYGTTYSNDISVNYPSTDTDYHPYSNICPIEGWSEVKFPKTGKNLIDHSKFALQSANFCWGYRNEGFLLKGGKTYTFSTNQIMGSLRLVSVDEQTVYAQSTNGLTVTYTPPKDTLVVFRLWKSEGITATQFQLELGSTATAYEPYAGNKYIINLGGTYYGGHFTQDKAGHRQLVVTHELKHLKDLNVRYSNNSGAWASWLFYVGVDDKKQGQPIKCTHYETVTTLSVGNLDNLKITAPTWSNYIYWRDDTYTSVNDFVQNAPDITILVELATPTIIDLPDGTPIKTLPGINNIYADTGNTSLQFRKIG